MKFLITVLSYRTPAFTRLAVDSILKNTDEPFDLLFINNDPNDNVTLEYIENLKKTHSNIILMNNPSNIGIAASWNNAIDLMFKNPEYGYMSLLHTDVVMNKNWASKIKQAFIDHPEYIGFAPVEINTDEVTSLTLPILTKNRMFGNYFQAYYIHSHVALLQSLNKMYDGNFEDKATEFESKLKGQIFPGAGYSTVTFKREVFEKVGYFDEMFSRGTEDSDFTDRMQRMGLRTAKTGDSFAHHFCSITFIRSLDIDGKQEAQTGQVLLAKKRASGLEKPCLRETCIANANGLCSKGIIINIPTKPCLQYELKG